MSLLTVEDALLVAVPAFVGKTDKGGRPYVLHLLHVMNGVGHEDDERMQIAVLHDIDEDTDWTLDELRMVGFSNRVLAAVELLTRREGDSYDDYINRIADSDNLDAIIVKIEDLSHNMDLSRLNRPAKQLDWDRANKYRAARVKLQNKAAKLGVLWLCDN